jgi:hypothetical protein
MRAREVSRLLIAVQRLTAAQRRELPQTLPA